MTPTELRRLMYATGYEDDPKAFAKALGVDARTVERWLKGETRVSKQNRHLLSLMKPRDPAFDSRFQAYLETLEAEGVARLATFAPDPAPAAPPSPAPTAPAPGPASSDPAPSPAPGPVARPARWYQRPAIWSLAFGGAGLVAAGIALFIAYSHTRAPVPTPEPPPMLANRDEPIEAPQMIPTGEGNQSPAPPIVAQAEINTPIPDEPLEGQARAPCTSRGDRAIKGGCWIGPIEDKRAPCGEDYYEHHGKCYVPRMAAPKKQPNSETPRKASRK